VNEWGIPDWRYPRAYGSVDKWSINRWRWEFLRRREDVRAAFDESADASFRYRQPFVGKPGFPAAHLRPDEPGFTAMHPLAQSLGLPQIPNPRIGAQAPMVIGFSDWEEGVQRFISEEPPENFERVDFDLRKPLEPQIKAARQLLKELQRAEAGSVLQKRRHPKKWLGYLRTLDAREAGASWGEIAALHPNSAQTEQTARDIWGQARALCFNF